MKRIYPKDEQGEGAIGLGVSYFIDNQLASAYGYNDREYMQEPFMEDKAEQRAIKLLCNAKIFF